ncbi:hypothetical protein [Photobacterium aquimaris]|uniref:Uncharacterized protein n=1 Tax=Photobacterium aquimaris TaxID=512643 RepID=A0A1Y6KV11_9GAMM|nr:hypothetical protein [Photobacterium aquimaris]SMY15931.1 hypothetical protein PAQU9191_01162 [Photobacterium aquimaris]
MLENVIALIGLPLFGTVVGAFLTNFFFPYKLKRKQWKWEKEVKARESLVELLSRIRFVTEHYLSSLYMDSFSMSNAQNVEEEVIDLVKNLHSESYKYLIYLPKKDQKVFKEFLEQSQKVFDKHKETYGQWHEDDYDAMERHQNNLLNELLELSHDSLIDMGFDS